MSTLRNIFILGLIPLFFLGLVGTVCSQEDDESVNVTITAQGEVLIDIIDEVYKQTGYKIDVKKDWETLPVRGEYVQVPLERFLTRIFKGSNVSIISDSQNKIYYVRLFGERINSKNIGSTFEPEVVDIHQLNEEQKKELQDYIADPNAVDPMSGMKLSVINSLHQEQKEEAAEISNTQEYQEINELHNLQRNQLKEDLENKTTKEPLSQMSLEEIEELHRSQSIELEEIKNNPDFVIDDTGMTLGELQALHENQRKEIDQLQKAN